MGGPSTVRGFEKNEIGPANLSRRPDIDHSANTAPYFEKEYLDENPDHWETTGGDYYLTLTVEGIFPAHRISEKVSTVSFFDVGHVGFLSPDIVPDSVVEGKERLFRYGLGLGIRYASQVGPMAIDFGLNPEPEADYEESWYELHFALGAL